MWRDGVNRDVLKISPNAQHPKDPTKKNHRAEYYSRSRGNQGGTYPPMQLWYNSRERRKLEKDKVDELGGQVLPVRDPDAGIIIVRIVVKLFSDGGVRAVSVLALVSVLRVASEQKQGIAAEAGQDL